MDVSEGQRFLRKRSIDDFNNDDNDEHWLWSHVNRIKRSLNDALGTENEQLESNSRVKRNWFDWIGTDAPSNVVTTTTEPSKGIDMFNWFGSPNEDEKSTTKAPDFEQPALEDDDNEIYDGSGYNQIDETHPVIETKLERFCKFCVMKGNNVFVHQ